MISDFDYTATFIVFLYEYHQNRTKKSRMNDGPFLSRSIVFDKYYYILQKLVNVIATKHFTSLNRNWSVKSA